MIFWLVWSFCDLERDLYVLVWQWVVQLWWVVRSWVLGSWTFFQLISEHQSPWNKILIKAAIFTEQHRLGWNDSYFFVENFFFRIPGCLEQILFSNNYFLVINTFPYQLLIEDKYFFSTATQLLFRKSFYSRTSNYSKFKSFSRAKTEEKRLRKGRQSDDERASAKIWIVVRIRKWAVGTGKTEKEKTEN